MNGLKRIMTLALTLSIIFVANAVSVENLIGELRQEKSATYVSIPKFVLKMAKFAGADVAGVSSLRVVNVEKCTKSTRNMVLNTIRKSNFDGFEPMLEAKDKNDNVYIFAKTKGETIKELLILTIENEEVNLVNIKGKFSIDSVGDIVNDVNVNI